MVCPYCLSQGWGTQQSAKFMVDAIKSSAYAIQITFWYDGDKIRGLQVYFSDGTSVPMGNIGSDASYNVVLIDNRQVQKTIVTNLGYASNYGYGSAKGLDLILFDNSTSSTDSYIFNTQNYDWTVDMSNKGNTIVGARGFVNADNFMNYIQFYTTCC